MAPSVMLEQPSGVGDLFFGGTVAGSGDLDGDGFDDLTVSAYGASANTGRVYVTKVDKVLPSPLSFRGRVETPLMITVVNRYAALCLLLSACGAAAVPTSPDAASDAPAPGATPVRDPEIVAMTSAVETSRIRADLETLVGFGTRNTCSPVDNPTRGIGAARTLLRQRFAALPGVMVRTNDFSQTVCSSGSNTQQNVMAWIPGATQPSRLVIVGGHYDSMGGELTAQRVDGTLPAPGANDSGSQTVLLLEAARVMAGRSYDATVVFVAFAVEEQGLYGSVHFVRSLAALFPDATVEAMFDCDIVGGDAEVNDAAALARFRLYSPGTPRELSAIPPDLTMEREGTPDDTSPARGIMRYVGTAGALYVPEMSMLPRLRQDRPGRSGDHVPFLDRGLPAVRFIDTNENRAHQHSTMDTVANMTPAYTARITRVVVSTMASLARAPRAPASFTATRDAMGRLALAWEEPEGGDVHHYVVAARPVTENLYRAPRVVARGALGGTWTAADLGVGGVEAYFVSVAAVDAQGHASLYAYPEMRCDPAGCVVQDGSLEVTRSIRL